MILEQWVIDAADYLHEREGLGDNWVYATHRKAADDSWLFCFKTRRPPMGLKFPDTKAVNITDLEIQKLEKERWEILQHMESKGAIAL